jgi:hypothetical protein
MAKSAGASHPESNARSRRRGGAGPRFFHRKTSAWKTGSSSCAAMANTVSHGSRLSIDSKKGVFFGLFCRKTGVRAKQNDTLFCVFTDCWDCFGLQVVAYEQQAPAELLQNKSCLKTYRRFFIRSGMCFNKPVKVEMTGRDEGCERSAALRAAALLSRNYAVARGARAHSRAVVGASPTKAHQSETCRSKRRPIPIPSRRNEKLWCNSLNESAIIPQPDCNSSREIAVDCTRLHQIAPNCTKLHQKINGGEENSPEEKYPAPIFLPPPFCLQSGRVRLRRIDRRFQTTSAVFDFRRRFP